MDHIRPMEGLRGLAVGLVFGLHYVTLLRPWLHAAPTLAAGTDIVGAVGQFGVDLFFVLSGYLIYGSLIKRDQPIGRFWIRRVERIYPAFTVVFLLYVALSFTIAPENKIPPGRPDAAMYLLQNFLLLPGLFPINPLITVQWSLSFEIFFYLTIPIVIAALRLRRVPSLARLAGVIVATVGFVAACVALPWPIRLISFLIGMLLVELEGLGVSPLLPLWAAVAAVFGVAARFLTDSFDAQIVAVAIGWGALCYTCFRSPSTWLGRLFSWTPLRWLGNMSYSYYLLHGVTLKAAVIVVAAIAPPATSHWLMLFIALPPLFLATVVTSGTLFLTVERPWSLRSGVAARRRRHTTEAGSLLANKSL